MSQIDMFLGVVPLIFTHILASGLALTKASGEAYEQNKLMCKGGPYPYVGFTCHRPPCPLPLFVGFVPFPGWDLGCLGQRRLAVLQLCSGHSVELLR